MYMMKYIWVFVSISVLGGAIYAAPVPNAALQRRTQQALAHAPNLFLTRFPYLHYYIPKDTFAPSDTDVDVQHEYALALYLVNMYATVNVYRETPSTFTLKYLGVFDGFEKSRKPFDFAQAQRFYKKHQKAVHAQLEKYLQAPIYTWAKPTQAQLTQWVALLENLPRKEGQAVFDFPATSQGPLALSQETHVRFAPYLSQTQPILNTTAVLFDEPDIRLEDFDSHIGNHTYRRKRTYRWVKEECFYNSYLLAKQLSHAMATTPRTWEHSRLYLVTAYPKQGEFLHPAQTERFQLANGTTGLHWRYHTAVLVILEQNNQYVPVVLDSFLGGQNPLTLAQWLAYFHPQTQFRAAPFTRSNTVENALKKPTRREGNAIWVDSHKYEPAPVLK